MLSVDAVLAEASKNRVKGLGPNSGATAGKAHLGICIRYPPVVTREIQAE